MFKRTKLPLAVALVFAAHAAIADTVIRGGAKGATGEARITSTPAGANHQALDVIARDSSGNEIAPATTAKQDVGNTSLSSLDGKVPAKGQAASAASTPVVVASDQTAIPTAPGIPAGSTAFHCITSAATATANMTCTPAGPAGTSKKYYVLGVMLNNGATAQTVKLTSSATSGCGSGTTDLTAAIYLPANGGGIWAYPAAVNATGATNAYLCLAPGTGGSGKEISGEAWGYIQ